MNGVSEKQRSSMKNPGNSSYLKDMILRTERVSECPGHLMKRELHENTSHECMEY